MPELPEVENYRQFLISHLKNRKIINIYLHEKKALKNTTISLLQKRLKNATFKTIERRGKYLLFFFQRDVLIIHLRMEGKFLINSTTNLKKRHLILDFQLDNQKWCQFIDSRKFATIHLSSIKNINHQSFLNRVGPDPFSKNINSQYLWNNWKKRRINVKSALLEQKIMSGIGNIYASEILYSSQLHPQTLVNQLNKAKITQLLIETRRILTKAIKEGGTTVKSYYINYKKGDYFQFLQVYGRKNLPCLKCQNLIQKIKLNQRGTYFCEYCQK